MRLRLIPLLALLCGGACVCGALDDGGSSAGSSCGGLGDGFGGVVVGQSPGAGNLQCLLLNPVRGQNNRLALDHNAGPAPFTDPFAAGSRVSLFLEVVDVESALSFVSEDESVVQVVGERQILLVGAGQTQLRVVDDDGIETDLYALTSLIPDEVVVRTLSGNAIAPHAIVDKSILPAVTVDLRQEALPLNHNLAVQVDVLERTAGVPDARVRSESFCQGIDPTTFATADQCPPCFTRLVFEGSGNGLMKVRIRAVANLAAEANFTLRLGEGGTWQDVSDGGQIAVDGGVPESDAGSISSDGGSPLPSDSGNP